jgi:hypothetical protein
MFHGSANFLNPFSGHRPLPDPENAPQTARQKNSSGFPNIRFAGINEIKTLNSRPPNFSLAVSWDINGLCD